MSTPLSHTGTVRLTDCTVDLARQRLHRGGEAATLTTREAELLAYLVEREGVDVDRDDLLRDVWGYRSSNPTRAVDFTIRRLRTKIEPDPTNPVHIIGVRGIGYRFVGADAAPPADASPAWSPEVGAVRDGSGPWLPDSPVTRRPDDISPSPALPSPRTRFVGRAAEIARLGPMIDQHRLVTVLGMGGAGKTALAVHWAHAVAQDGRFPGGIGFCELAAAREPAEVLHAVAAGLGITLDGRATREQGVDHVCATLDARGRSLVVFDNAEHVDLAPLVEQWLDRTFDARFLVTSRERLQVPGEAVLVLAPLDDREGAELFVDRARAARGADAVTDADAAAVQAIVRGLDGLPLAIEIAASRVATMSPTQLAARLESRFRLITAPAGSRPDRHASLGATLDWSWDLLDAWERKALAVASVFRGGFGLEAVEEVLLLEDPAAPWPLDLLQSLVDKSLVCLETPEGSRALRYRLLESVRAYAGERLPDLVDAKAVRARHADYYIREGEALAAAVEGPGGAEMLDRLAAERGNLMGAWLQAPDPVQRVRAGLALRVVLMHRGPFDGLRGLLDELVAVAASAPDDLRARAHVARARFHGDHHPTLAEHDLRAALAAAGSHGEVRAMALYTLATLRAEQGRYVEAEGQYREAMELHEAAGARAAVGRDAVGLAFALSRRGELDEAERTYQRALAAFRRSGDRWGVGLALANLAWLLDTRGDWSASDQHAREAVEILGEVGDRKNCSRVLCQLGIRLSWRGALGEAESMLRRALALQQQIGDRRWEGVVLTDLAEVLVHRDNLAEAEALLLTAGSLAREAQDRLQESQVLRMMGLLRLLEEQDMEAEVHLEDATALLEGQEHPVHLAETLYVRALLCIDRDRPRDALAHLDDASARLVAGHPRSTGVIAAARTAALAQAGEPAPPPVALPTIDGLREVLDGWQAWASDADRRAGLDAVERVDTKTHPLVVVLRRALERASRG